jgi:hypothetical protein
MHEAALRGGFFCTKICLGTALNSANPADATRVIKAVRDERSTMHREDIKKLIPDIDDEQLDKIMSWNGADIEKQKSVIATLTAERDDFRTRLEEASGKLEGYDPEWKAKAAEAQKDAEKRIQDLQFGYALDAALVTEKARNPATVKALLKLDALALNDGKIVGLAEQLEAIRKENGYLFESDTPTPTITMPSGLAPSKNSDKEYLDDYYKNNPFYKK